MCAPGWLVCGDSRDVIAGSAKTTKGRSNNAVEGCGVEVSDYDKRCIVRAVVGFVKPDDIRERTGIEVADIPDDAKLIGMYCPSGSIKGIIEAPVRLRQNALSIFFFDDITFRAEVRVIDIEVNHPLRFGPENTL